MFLNYVIAKYCVQYMINNYYTPLNKYKGNFMKY